MSESSPIPVVTLSARVTGSPNLRTLVRLAGVTVEQILERILPAVAEWDASSPDYTSLLAATDSLPRRGPRPNAVRICGIDLVRAYVQPANVPCVGDVLVGGVGELAHIIGCTHSNLAVTLASARRGGQQVAFYRGVYYGYDDSIPAGWKPPALLPQARGPVGTTSLGLEPAPMRLYDDAADRAKSERVVAERRAKDAENAAERDKVAGPRKPLVLRRVVPNGLVETPDNLKQFNGEVEKGDPECLSSESRQTAGFETETATVIDIETTEKLPASFASPLPAAPPVIGEELPEGDLRRLHTAFDHLALRAPLAPLAETKPLAKGIAKRVGGARTGRFSTLKAAGWPPIENSHLQSEAADQADATAPFGASDADRNFINTVLDLAVSEDVTKLSAMKRRLRCSSERLEQAVALLVGCGAFWQAEDEASTFSVVADSPLVLDHSLLDGMVLAYIGREPQAPVAIVEACAPYEWPSKIVPLDPATAPGPVVDVVRREMGIPDLSEEQKLQMAADIEAKIAQLKAIPPALGAARVTAPRAFTFPADHGAHFDYATEWWYFSGNVTGKTVSGQDKAFAFHVAFFRNGTTQPDGALSDLMMCHFSLLDVAAGRYLTNEYLCPDVRVNSEPAAELGKLCVWTGEAMAMELNPRTISLTARGIPFFRAKEGKSGVFEIDFRLSDLRGPVVHRGHGVAQKGDEEGEATYYCQHPRHAVAGSIVVDEDRYEVTDGTAWFDHEWGTRFLGADQAGWDWLGLHLDDGTDVCLYALRYADGAYSTTNSGRVIEADGTIHELEWADYELQPLGEWVSPATSARYPAKMKVVFKKPGLRLCGVTLTVTPRAVEQEFVSKTSKRLSYWEGSVKVEGMRLVIDKDDPNSHHFEGVTGLGHMELTGYAEPMGAVL